MLTYKYKTKKEKSVQKYEAILGKVSKRKTPFFINNYFPESE